MFCDVCIGRSRYLTVGIVSGNPPGGRGLGSVGIDFKTWSLTSTQYDARAGVGSLQRDSAVFWMAPDSGPRADAKRSIVVAQVSLSWSTNRRHVLPICSLYH